ncbi:nuclease-related domain-containing DEAD/DEAH box helicase [Gallibacterium anatis]|uniref:nuclease-related domain-containing DEAD/DEAH box helicase n=1 Tax=Gallibacterium anatis TaxID=750 RepID=UPI000B9FA23C|nr:NERD domain-containing protein/DEAD/DEAH box helicase [Gallibacterium anatis]OZN48441.1 ATP-dependent helicase [Gallibacterium anatis]
MAIIYPDFSIINLLKVKPTDGELHLLRQLEKNLDDSYEIFFQPFLNGDMPDIVIVRKGFGVYIIEVKDWDLNSYKIKVNNEKGKKYEWFVKKNGEHYKIISPISQVFKYKINLYNLHIEGLLEKRIKNPKMFGIVNCGIYFHKHSTSFCNNFIKAMKEEKFIKYFDIFGFDDAANIVKTMHHRRMNKPSKLFDNNLYDSIKRNLLPPLHVKEQGIPITYSKEQEKIIKSNNGRKKFKGVAGSGKTICLAKKAVNAYLRTNKEVLILTFNISLRNYIHDKISQIKENFNWKNFKILNYHEFFIAQANNYNLKVESISDWDNPNFFESVKNEIVKYDTIIIDEVQDYRKPWIQLINKYFLEENGEYAVFGDEKQNIYHRDLDDDKAPYTQISGAWNKLKETFRLSSEITKLAQRFQEEFLKEKYVTDDILLAENQLSLELTNSTINYYFIDNLDINYIVEKYKLFLQKNLLHENDACFLGGKIDTLREIDFIIRKKYHQKTKSMFETKEMYHYLEQKKLPKEKFKEEIKLIRKNKKLHFWNNSGLLKLSTTHSFKGWEVNTIFLIIENISIGSEEYLEEKMDDLENQDELIYTAITRSRQNLIIFNIGNTRYHDFFSKHI